MLDYAAALARPPVGAEQGYTPRDRILCALGAGLGRRYLDKPTGLVASRRRSRNHRRCRVEGRRRLAWIGRRRRTRPPPGDIAGVLSGSQAAGMALVESHAWRERVWGEPAMIDTTIGDLDARSRKQTPGRGGTDGL
jgi:hypothetical protein